MTSDCFPDSDEPLSVWLSCISGRYARAECLYRFAMACGCLDEAEELIQALQMNDEEASRTATEEVVNRVKGKDWFWYWANFDVL